VKVELKVLMGSNRQEWETYKRLRRYFLLVWLLYIPVFLAAVLASVVIFGKGSTLVMLAIAVVTFAWIGLFLLLAKRLREWNCPRCHRPFQSWWKGIFASNCANCGLEKYST